MVEQVGPGSFLLDARLSIRAWASSLAGFGAGMPVPVRQLADWGPGRPVTVGGLVTTLLGRWPVVGDQVGCPSADGQLNLRFTVTEMHGRRLVKVRVDVLAEGSTEAS
jgi:CBS domain containing-hemolysin-like protein